MIRNPKCFIDECMNKPYGKCDCDVNHVLFCQSHALQHIEDVENNKRHRCLKLYFKPHMETKALIKSKLIEMNENLLKLRSKLIKNSKEIIKVVKNSLTKALANISKLEEKFSKLIYETEREEFFDIASKNDFESIFKLNPLDAKMNLKNWSLSTANIANWDNITEKVERIISISTPELTQAFLGQDTDSLFKIQRPISDNQRLPSLFSSLTLDNSQGLCESNSQDLFKPNNSQYLIQPKSQSLLQPNSKGLLHTNSQGLFHPINSLIQPNNSIQPNSAIQPSSAIHPNSVFQPNSAIQPNSDVQPSSAIQPNNAIKPNSAIQPSIACQPNSQGLFQLNSQGGFQINRPCGFQPNQSTLLNPGTSSCKNIQTRDIKFIKYHPTPVQDDASTVIYVTSINANYEFESKSLEELRLEYYKFNTSSDDILNSNESGAKI